MAISFGSILNNKLPTVYNWVQNQSNYIVMPSEVLKAAVDVWLDIPDASVHLSRMLVSSAAVGGKRTTNQLTDNVRLASDFKWITEFMSKTSEATDALNDLMTLTADCNIDGIPIKTSRMSCDRQIQVSDTTVITQESRRRDTAILNATPKGRVIQINGYLQPISDIIDSYYVVKPSLLAQIDYLDAMSTSRRPVWFKDRMNRFYKMQITNFHYDDTPEATTAIAVSITMQEYITLNTESQLLNNIASFVGKVRQVGI